MGGVSTGTPLYCKNQPDTKPTGRWGQKSSQISVAATQTVKNKQTDEEETVTFKQRVKMTVKLAYFHLQFNNNSAHCVRRKNYMRSSAPTPPLLLQKNTNIEKKFGI